VALAAHHLALGLPRLVFESRPLALDPPEFADHRQAHRLIAHRPRRGPSTAFCFLTPESWLLPTVYCLPPTIQINGLRLPLAYRAGEKLTVSKPLIVATRWGPG